MLLITCSQTSSKMVEKKLKWPIYFDCSHFTSIILPYLSFIVIFRILRRQFDIVPVGAITSNLFHVSCSHSLCSGCVDNQISDKSNNGGGLLSSVFLFRCCV